MLCFFIALWGSKLTCLVRGLGSAQKTQGEGNLCTSVLTSLTVICENLLFVSWDLYA